MTDVEPDAAVVTRVSILAAASARPVLTAEEVKATIQNYPRVDVDGYQADAEDWSQTWDIYAAVAELWAIKAGKVAGDFNFSADDASYSKGAVLANCLAMEAQYAAKAAGSQATGAYYGKDSLEGVIVNG